MAHPGTFSDIMFELQARSYSPLMIAKTLNRPETIRRKNIEFPH